MEVIEKQLSDLSVEVQNFAKKAQEEITNVGAVATETKSAIDTIKSRIETMQNQLDVVDAKTKTRPGCDPEDQKSLGQLVTASDVFQQMKAQGGPNGTKATRFRIEGQSVIPSLRKTITETALGNGTTGVIGFQRIPGIVDLAMQALRIRDIMNVVTQSTGNAFDFVYQSTRTNVASPQVEGSAKNYSTYNWQSTSGAIRTIAHLVKVSRQGLDDVPWMRGKIDSEMIYGLKVKEEAEILSGDNTGVHLNGLITQATAFDTTALVAAAGYTYLDVLRYAKLQARLAGLATYAPSAFVLHPHDLAKIELTKDSYGRYIVGDPKSGTGVPVIWGLPAVESDSIASGTFLVGAFNSAADLIDRQQVTVDISFENDDDFEKNMATLRCEERIGLAVTKATAFITGSFVSSPATT